jgi:hypothetical protein
MPGDGLTHGPPATKNAGGSDHRLSRIDPAFPAQWCYGLYAPSPVSDRCPGLIATVVERNTCFAQLDPSVGRSGPRDFAVRVSHARPACHPRPSHPRPTVRDDRPKRPSSSRQDARNAAGDLPDGASGIFATGRRDGRNGRGRCRSNARWPLARSALDQSAQFEVRTR